MDDSKDESHEKRLFLTLSSIDVFLHHSWIDHSFLSLNIELSSTESTPFIKVPLHTIFKVTPAAYTRSEGISVILGRNPSTCVKGGLES